MFALVKNSYIKKTTIQMTNEAAIVMLAYVIIASIFLFFGTVFFAVKYFKDSFDDIHSLVRTTIILYEKEKERIERPDSGGTSSFDEEHGDSPGE